jgi:hypothetical protein
MKTSLTFALLLFFSLAAAAQQKTPYTFLKTGQITAEALKMNRYDPDTSAGAVVLYDGGKTRFSSNAGSGFSLSHERHVIVKILKKSGYDEANVEIPLFLGDARHENIQALTGFTYNLVNGKIVTDKLGKEAIFEEKTNPDYNTQKFTLPNVKEGSVVEYTYRIQSPFIQTFRYWNFQHQLPVAWSEYRAEIPSNFEYKTMVQGYEPFYATETKAANMTLNFEGEAATLVGKETRWIMKNVPALREEPFVSSLLNYQSRIEFELANVTTKYYMEERKNNSWEKISETLLKSADFGLYFNRSGFAKEYLPAILNGISDPEKQLTAIHTYLKKAVVNNNSEVLAPKQPLRKVLETKKASASEINLLLLCFLREAGFTAEPVLLSTRNHGLLTSATFPNIQKFNYVIVYAKAGEKDFLLDATEPLATINTLPEKCLNGEGLILSATKPLWADLRSNGKASKVIYTKVDFTKDLAMQGKMQVSCTGYSALNQRKELAIQGEKKFMDELISKCENRELADYSVQPQADPAEALKFELNFSVPGQSSNAATIYLQPIMDQKYRQNPLKAETRKYPVDFTVPLEETYIYNYTIPAGYRIEEQPKNALVTLPENGGKYTYSITSAGNSINVISKISIDRPVFGSEEYPYLKEFFNQILAKQAEQIVLKKIN